MAPILTRVIRDSKVFWIELFRFADQKPKKARFRKRPLQGKLTTGSPPRRARPALRNGEVMKRDQWRREALEMRDLLAAECRS
jgi:hypothetical protein